MKRISGILFLAFMLVFNLAASNETGKEKSSAKSVISGTITDKLTGEPLAGVEVKLMDSDVKVYTDFDGKFEMKNVTPGAQAIVVSYISYQDIIENVLAETGNTATVTIRLKSVEK
jgi:hypothetical protein